MYVNYKGHMIKFLDSWKILMASVSNLGKSMGLPKLDLDYDAYSDYKDPNDVPLKAIEYLERDIDVVIAAFTKVVAIYEKKMTRAGMAYEDFKAFYNDENENGRQFSIDFGGKVWDFRNREMKWHNVLTKDEWIKVNRSYQGGYVYWNHKYTDKEVDTPNGVSYDVNSLFPAMMELYRIPYGKMYYTKPIGFHHVAMKTILIKKAKIKDPTWPPLIKKHGGKYKEAKYLLEVENTEYTFWEEELEFIKSKYDMEYIEISTVYFKTKWVFKNWLGIKKKYKIEAKDPVERAFHKGIYNSEYGKFAQNIFMGSRIIVEDGLHVDYIEGDRYLCEEDGNIVRKLAKNAVRYGKNGELKHEAMFVESDQYKHIAVASYITSKARLTLWDAQYKNIDIWLYSDTDSCYFMEEPVGLDIHESKFGAWKPEHKFTKFKVLRAKAYIIQSTAEWKNGQWNPEDIIVKKISGLSDEGKEKVNFENFYLGSIIKEGKRGVKNVKGGKLIYNSDFKLGDEVFN